MLKSLPLILFPQLCGSLSLLRIENWLVGCRCGFLSCVNISTLLVFFVLFWVFLENDMK